MTFDDHLEPDLNSGCLLWSGTTRAGYGAVQVGRRKRSAHRVAWERTWGKIPTGLCVLHKCDTPTCCNPRHLFLGTRADNNLDARLKGRARRPNTVGIANGNSKLTREQVDEIRSAYAAGGISQRSLAEHYAVSESQIRNIVSAKRWAARNPGAALLVRMMEHPND